MITDKYYCFRPYLKLFSDQFVIQIFNQRHFVLDPHTIPVKSTAIDKCMILGANDAVEM